jgi:hypothetical protein
VDEGPAETHVTRELAHVDAPGPKRREDAQPVGIGKRGEDADQLVAGQIREVRSFFFHV